MHPFKWIYFTYDMIQRRLGSIRESEYGLEAEMESRWDLNSECQVEFAAAKGRVSREADA